MSRLVVTALALVMIAQAACDPSLRGTLDQQLASDDFKNTGNLMDADAPTTGRGLQQTNIQSFIDSLSFNDTTPTDVSGSVTHQPQDQPQIATSPNVGGGPGVVFGGGAQPGASGIAGSTPLPLGT